MRAVVIHYSRRPWILTMGLLSRFSFLLSPFPRPDSFHMLIKPWYTHSESNCFFLLLPLFPHISFMLLLMANNLANNIPTYQSRCVRLCCSDKHPEYLGGSVTPHLNQGLDGALLYAEGGASVSNSGHCGRRKKNMWWTTHRAFKFVLKGDTHHTI